jgi:hypothetical protein
MSEVPPPPATRAGAAPSPCEPGEGVSPAGGAHPPPAIRGGVAARRGCTPPAYPSPVLRGGVPATVPAGVTPACVVLPRRGGSRSDCREPAGVTLQLLDHSTVEGEGATDLGAHPVNVPPQEGVRGVPHPQPAGRDPIPALLPAEGVRGSGEGCTPRAMPTNSSSDPGAGGRGGVYPQRRGCWEGLTSHRIPAHYPQAMTAMHPPGATSGHHLRRTRGPSPRMRRPREGGRARSGAGGMGSCGA